MRYSEILEQNDRLGDLARRFIDAGMYHVEIVREVWLIHFPRNAAEAASILRRGFQQGSPLDTDNLLATTGTQFRVPGLNFAYPTDDPQELRFIESYEPPDSAVVFRADGVRMKHPEGHLQVAFVGTSAVRPFVQIRRAGKRSWQIVSVDDQPMAGTRAGLLDLISSIRKEKFSV